jgi:glycosyltransferase involved in cell wall biosynthesis
MHKIDILLATYNSGRFLRKQIESIINQGFRDWRLIVRDAGSADDTIPDILEFARQDGRILYIGSDHADALMNFSKLLLRSTAKYVMFADQDDVWLEDKLAKSLEKMKELESEFGKDTPLLVFTDAKVVDSDLNVLDESLFNRTNIDPRRLRPEQLILQNVGNGNTMLFNAALREKAKPISENTFMHDHWIALVASVFGKTACLNEPTLLYRQHDRNVLGGSKVGALYYFKKLCGGVSAVRKRLSVYIRQAEAFALFYPDAPDCFKACVGLEKKNWVVRRWLLLRHGIFKNGLLRNIGVFLLI